MEDKALLQQVADALIDKMSAKVLLAFPGGSESIYDLARAAIKAVNSYKQSVGCSNCGWHHASDECSAKT